jgi:serine/threonine-protein kinase
VRPFDFSHYALSIGIAVVLLSGCGGSQSPISAPGAMAQLVPAARETKANALLYVTEFTRSAVLIYDARTKNPSPHGAITDGLTFPSGDCVDADGVLYVANQPVSGPGWISEYPPGKMQPSKVIKKGLNTPAYCALDSNGNLWVTNISGPNVTEYRKGSTKPNAVITQGLTYPVGIAIDSSDNIYVSNGNGARYQNVQVYSSGSKTPTRTITDGIISPVGITVDANNTLYVTNIDQNDVVEYLSGKSYPYRTITKLLNQPQALTVNRKGWLYVANGGNSVVVEFPPGSITPAGREISKGLYLPQGLAHFPPLLP